MLLLNADDLRIALEMRDVISAVEEGFRAVARGEVKAPERMRFDIPEANAIMLQMPAHARKLQSAKESTGDSSRGELGTKIVSVFEKNVERGLDVVQAVYLLFDEETGVPLALMEGRFITAIRTAATSAVATKFMASAGPKQLAIFGAGVQARFHVDAMMEVATIERVMICSRSEDKARALADLVSSQYGVVCELVSPYEAAATANLICTCTTANAPLFEGKLLKPGTHINAVGAFTPSTRELDTETVSRSRLIIDSQSAAGKEAGEILIPVAEGRITPSHITGTLDELVSGKIKGRNSDDEITLFKSCGLAVEDLVTARLAYERAKAMSVGIQAAF